MLNGEHSTGSAKAGLHLIDNEENSILLTDFFNLPKVHDRRYDKPALAKYGLGDDGGHFPGSNLRPEDLLDVVWAMHIAARVGTSAAVGVREGDSYYLRQEGIKADFIGPRLPGKSEGKHCSAMEGTLEGNDRATASIGTGNFYGVLDRFGPAGKEDRFLSKGAGGYRIKLLCQADIGLIQCDHKAEVEVPLSLIRNGGHNLRCPVSHV